MQTTESPWTGRRYHVTAERTTLAETADDSVARERVRRVTDRFADATGRKAGPF